MDLMLKDKVAVIAASSRGLGRACAAALLSEGAKVVINGRDSETLQKTKSELEKDGGDVLAIPGDVSKPKDVVKIIEQTFEHFGQLDILVTNAGGPTPGSFSQLTEEDWYDAFSLNMMSAVGLIKTSLPHLKESAAGRIINISSIAAKTPMPEYTLSSSVRIGIHGLSATLVDELGESNITINTVVPGYTLTDRMKSLYEKKAKAAGKNFAEVLEEISVKIPLGRIGSPQDVGALVAFLASQQAGYITGASFTIDGGVTRTIS